MGVMIGLTILVIAGCVLLLWHMNRQERRARQEQLRRRRQADFALALDEIKQEFTVLVPALYKGDRASQRAVGVSVNLAMAFFRSVYPSVKSFAAVSGKEQREFIRKLGEAEQLFHERDKAEAGAALTLLKCWLTAIGAGDVRLAAEVKRHLDFFSQKPLEEYSEPIVTPTSKQWAS